MKHTIFRSDSCSYTHDGALIRTGIAPADIDNGMPVVIGTLASTGAYDGEREVFTVAHPAAATDDVWVVTTPELDYTTFTKGDFYNKKDAIIRLSKLVKYDIFSISAGTGLSATPSEANKYITPKADGGWTVSSSDTNAFAQLINVETVGDVIYYVYTVL